MNIVSSSSWIEYIADAVNADFFEPAIVDLDRQIAVHVAHISNKLKLAVADSIILATARAYDATLWTQDEHFKGIEGVRYKEKPAKNKS